MKMIVDTYKVQSTQNDITTLINKVNAPHTTAVERNAFMKEILAHQAELTIFINDAIGIKINYNELVEKFDMSYLRPDRLCFDMRWYIQKFLPYGECVGKNYYHYKCDAMIEGWFMTALQQFQRWSAGAKRLFLINNMWKKAEQYHIDKNKPHPLINNEYLKLWIMKTKEGDLVDLLFFYKNADFFANNSSTKMFEVRNKYGKFNCAMPPITKAELAGRVMWVNKRVSNCRKDTMKYTQLCKDIKEDWNKKKYMDLTM